MTPFLKIVAEYFYAHCENLKTARLVFPNRRSGVFFLKYLSELNDKNIWLPEILTINEFIEEQSRFAQADQVELLIELYKVYVEVTSSKEQFDDFYFWGEIMLNDFNDVDKYNINPESVFSNVMELKSIDSGFDYLTDEQKKVLERFFSEFDPEENSKLKENFLQIWNYLLPVYQKFKANLKKQGVAYEGMLYQDAMSRVKSLAIGDNIQYYFVGFNAITKCEEEIFEYLQTQGKALFFWDYDAYYLNNKVFEAGYFMRNYVRRFLSPDDFKQTTNNFTKAKSIKVKSTPTNAGQVALAGRFFSENEFDDFSKSALVLADELLLQPALNYLPKQIDAINITMGYPVKDTLAGSFIDLLLRLKLQNKGKQTLYFKNVLPLLKHPYISSAVAQESAVLIDKINKERIVNLSKGDWESNRLLDLLLSSFENVNEFTENLLQILEALQEHMVTVVDDGIFELDFEQVYNIYLLIRKLKNQLAAQKVELTLPVFVKLIKKMIYRLRVPFEGEPVKGLQIMGFLETRNLDFENLIILSTNDSLLPSTNVTPSFVPYSLRRGFGLPTRELHDAMYAYYFYRIIQRASNVVLVYNSGTSGMSTGDKSRFVQQLLYDGNFNISEEADQYTIDLAVLKPTVVPKTGLVKELLSEYLLQENGRILSPSAIVNYLTCPLKFYYQQILRLRDEDELTESVDARLFGNIFHHAAENLYAPYEGRAEGLTKSVIETIAKNDKLIDEAIQKAFNTTFFGESSERKFLIKGKNQLVAGIIKKYLQKMFDIDAVQAPITIVGLEKSYYRNISFTVGDASFKINVGGNIDRLDKVGDSLRIIDYKTGGDTLSFKQLEDVFNPEKISTHKAIVQTFIYSLVILHHFQDESSVVPGVYKVKEFFKSNFTWRLTSKELEAFAESNFNRISNDVELALKDILADLFDFNKPFEQTNVDKHCAYCSFKTMCGK